MEFSTPYNFKLTLSGPENKRGITLKIKDGKEVKFSHPLTKKKLPKIYVIKIKGELVYIGYTSQSITSRLNYGFKINGENGYYGYKWRNISEEIELMVFVSEKALTGDKDEDKKTINFVEAIEAELVFKFREKTGNWPKYQNEIHFNNESRKLVLVLAKKIFTYIIE